MTIFQAIKEELNKNVDARFYNIHEFFRSIQNRTSKFDSEESIRKYLNMLHAAGFITKHHIFASKGFKVNYEIPELINSSNIKDVVVVRQFFDETSEHKTGWEFSYAEFINQTKLCISNVDIWNTVDYLEFDKYYNPTVVLKCFTDK
jgi:DNA polymerase III sliding clamp (beta) subunit (PCNA family)